MRVEEIRIDTGDQPTVVDLTPEIAGFCRELGDGLLSIFAPHATAGLAIIETGSGTETDLLSVLEELLPPHEGRWRHSHGSPGHGRDHVLPAFIAPSVTVPVRGGRMTLGTWQSIVLVDTNRDNFTRRIVLSFLEG